jgi:hypothetical protein
MLTAERLRELLAYDPETGAFTWRVRSGGKSTVGSPAGCDDASGYRKIRVDGRNYYGHRLAFLHMTGTWPQDQADHINRDRADNRWANLREADRSLNARNTGARQRNKLGVKGVHRIPGGSFRAAIHCDGQTRRLGCFSTIEEASAAYARAGGVS